MPSREDRLVGKMPDLLFEYIPTDGDTPFSQNSRNHVKSIINWGETFHDIDSIKLFMT